MKPSADQIEYYYPRRSEYPRAALYTEIGWDDVVDHPAFKDTCAIRMSVALARAGMSVPGTSMRAKASSIKGKPIEVSQLRLSKTLRRLWGAPEIFTSGEEAREAIGQRRGVISFFQVDGSPQGHIDFIYPSDTGFSQCSMACKFDAKSVWFWPLR